MNILLVTALIAALPWTDASSVESQSYTSRAVPPDTTWVDHPRPIMKTDAIRELSELWASGKYRGACLLGDVETRVGLGRVAVVYHVSSAAMPDRCTGFRRYVGAVLFIAQEEAPAAHSPGDRACDLLLEHPEWGVAGEVTGLEEQTLRSPEGRVLGRVKAPVAWFCGWYRSADRMVSSS